MSGDEWLKKQFDEVKREVESWPEWKKSSIEDGSDEEDKQQTVTCEAQNKDND